MKPLRIATRNSPLALWQANFAKQELQKAHPDLQVEIVGMTTKGDQLLDRSLAKVGGKGLFLKELEVSLTKGETDIAVHSMKDVPVDLPSGLEIAAVFEREDARDAFVSNDYQNLYALPEGARVGTSSLRRVAQLQHAFPKLQFLELRGNVNTRLAKLDAGDYDAIILAAAGLIRLQMQDRIKQYISPELCLPAVGQGIVGVECRSDDEVTKALLKPLHSKESELFLAAERSMNAALEGGCQVPVAGFAEIDRGRMVMRAAVGAPDGSRLLVSENTTPGVTVDNASRLGELLADDLIKQGAKEILEAIYHEPKEEKTDALSEKPVVILTRQHRYLGNTAAILHRLDYQVTHIPSLAVKPNEGEQLDQLLSKINDFDDVVFVSRNAVDIGMSMLEKHGGLPRRIRVMAVGSETAKQLYKFGIDALFPSSGSGAQALLEVAQLADLSGRRILIIRGTDGLDWPAEEMQRRGARVKQALCYKQAKPKDSTERLRALLMTQQRIDGVFAHSSQSLRNLVDMAKGQRDKLLSCRLVVGSERIADTAREFGWKGELLLAESPSNKHMMIAFSQ